MIGNTKIHPREHEKILKLSETKHDKEIAITYGVTPGTIYKIRKKYGILKPRHFKYEKNHSYFENLDRPEKFYMLGLIYSDGFLTKGNSVGLCLHPEDESVINFFKKELKFVGPTTICIKQTKSKKSFLKRVDIHSKKLYDDLVKLGLCQNKSLKIKWPIWMENSDYIWNFLLGVFDGDGSVTVTSKKPVATITGSADFCYGLKAFLAKHEIFGSIQSYKNTKVKTLKFVSKNARNFCNKLISSQDFSMRRKRDLINYINYCYSQLMINGRVAVYAISKDSYKLFCENDEETFKQIILEKNALYRSEALKILKQHSDDLKSKKLTS